MTTDARKTANRKNALLSTGPVTPQGKAAVRLNALKHGLRAANVILPHENAEAFEALADALRERLTPADEMEGMLVERAAALFWRLRRATSAETAILTRELVEIEHKRAGAGASTYHRLSPGIDLAAFGIDQEALDEAEKRRETPAAKTAMAREREAAARREEALPTLGLAYVRDAKGADALSKLSRYETSRERSLFKTLHELERMQARRRGEAVAAPLAVDVTVSADTD